MKSLSKINLLSLLLVLCVGASALNASAKPADPRPRTVVQPDGTSLTVTLRGDEHCHYYVTADGHLLSREGDSYFLGSISSDGRISSTGLLAHEPAFRSADEVAFLRSLDKDALSGALDRRALRAASRANMLADDGSDKKYPGLYPWNTFPSIGAHKVLVILVDFTDVPFNLKDPYGYFDNMLNQPGFDEYNGTGSAADYFRENSMGQFDPEFDVYGPVTMAHDHVYYGGNDAWGNDLRAWEMIVEACQALDDTVDFSQYDSNGDGLVDNVYVYYAGLGEAGEGGADTIWPHAWNVSYGTSTEYVLDGVKLDRYACSNEWEYGLPDGIGTFIHEFSHVLGLPDLYSTSYNSAYTPGPWSIMDTGVYNNNSRTPPYMSGFERIALGWLQPKVIDGPADIVISHVAENEAYVIPTDSENEYFVLENRQKTGWDKYLPGHGMLAWHIDYSSRVWYDNAVNNTASHQRVDLEEADGSKGDKRSGQTFPGTKGITSFTDDTTPSMRRWNNNPLGLPIENIREADNLISFIVAGGYVEYGSISLSEATDVKARSFSISWTPDDAAAYYVVTLSTATPDGSDACVIEPVEGWTRRNVGNVTSLTIDGLNPETIYYVQVEATNGYGYGEPSNTVKVATAVAGLDDMIPEVKDATEIAETSFVANWSPVPGASAYNLYVYTKALLDVSTEVCDFTGGVANLPEGWVSTSTLSYANDAYTGQAAPALRLGAHNASITTRTYDSDVIWLEFWHRGSNVTSDSHLKVLARIGEEWDEVASLPICTAEGGATLRVDSLPLGTNTLRLSLYSPSGQGSVAIDDIVVGWGGVYEDVKLDGYDGVNVGDVCAAPVTGLKPASVYYYRVTATDGALTSMISDEVAVQTLCSSGISDVVDAIAAYVHAADGKIHVKGAAGQPVSVYDVTGRLISAGEISADGSAELAVPAKGILVVRVGSKAVKVRM